MTSMLSRQDPMTVKEIIEAMSMSLQHGEMGGAKVATVIHLSTPITIGGVGVQEQHTTYMITLRVEVGNSFVGRSHVRLLVW